MNEELDNTNETTPPYWNEAFERKYGDLLRELVLIWFKNTTPEGIIREKELFYYKLQVLNWLCDPTVKVGDPSKELTFFFKPGLKDGEFSEFKEQALYVLNNDPTSEEFITSEIMKACDSVILNPTPVLFFFDFQTPKPRNLN